jgi:alkanesulfonate monooxygenase SsuD/methylene tetrahydromethanopterin reductase-like flavin-dependent oxidoreductase (luciferase family)
MDETLELGLDTFGDVTADAAGTLLPHAQVIRNVVAEGVLADQLGIDFFGVGEHHRADYSISAPDVVLAAIAARTTRIRLGSAVTVLSSDEPVRLFQRFSTLDAVSNGRAEVILGLEGGPVTWQGTVRPPLKDQLVFPPIEHGRLRTWVGVGGSPQSVVRAASHGLPLMLAIIGGDPARFQQYVDLHHRAYAHFGRPVAAIGVHSPGHVAETDAQAREELWPHFQRQNAKIGAERGWPPMQRADFEREADSGSLYVGSPETVARRIARTARLLQLSRFDLKYSVNQLPHESLMRSIELYGTQVIPMVRDILASRPTQAVA